MCRASLVRGHPRSRRGHPRPTQSDIRTRGVDPLQGRLCPRPSEGRASVPTIRRPGNAHRASRRVCQRRPVPRPEAAPVASHRGATCERQREVRVRRHGYGPVATAAHPDEGHTVGDGQAGPIVDPAERRVAPRRDDPVNVGGRRSGAHSIRIHGWMRGGCSTRGHGPEDWVAKVRHVTGTEDTHLRASGRPGADRRRFSPDHTSERELPDLGASGPAESSSHGRSRRRAIRPPPPRRVS
jgi:hypothetical protein